MTESRRIFFHHLPKTAGTSFRQILMDVYGEARVSPKIPGSNVGEAVRSYAACAAISGHMRAMPGDVLPAGYYSVTVLRDPLERFISEFFFSKHDFQAFRPDLQAMKSQELEQFLEKSTAQSDYAWNLQVETLYPYGCSEPSDPTAEQKLKAAKEALEQFDTVGVQEEFADFVQVVGYDLGWPPVIAIPRENVTTRRPALAALPDLVRRQLIERTAIDAELHEHALGLFRRKRRRVLIDCARTRFNAGAQSEDPGSVRSAGSAGYDAPRSNQAGLTEGREDSSVEFGNRRLEIQEVTVVGDLHESRALLSGEMARISIRFSAHEAVDSLTVGVGIRDEQGRLAFGTNTRLLGYHIKVSAGRGHAVTFGFRNDLSVGKYAVQASLHLGTSHLAGCFHWREKAAEFEIVGNIGDHYEGRAKLYPSVAVSSTAGDQSIGLETGSANGRETLQRLDRPNPPLHEFLAQIRPIGAIPKTFRAGDELAVQLEIENTGAETWSAAGIRPVRIGFHWFDLERNWIDFEGLRTTLPHDVGAGGRVRVWCVLRVPEFQGDAILVWSLVQEEVAWFDAKNANSALSAVVNIKAQSPG